jgi:hypothetical protein
VTRPSDLPWTSLRSDGALCARGYATAPVPPSEPRPVPDAERVIIVDPRRAPTLPSDRRKSAGARAPDQMKRPEPSNGIELPDRRPLMKTQRVWIEPELIARWQAEADAEAAQAVSLQGSSAPLD